MSTQGENDFSAIIPYEGFQFEFSSNRWIEPVRATEIDPPEGGYFEDFLIELDGRSAEKILNDDTKNEIVRLAVEEKLRR